MAFPWLAEPPLHRLDLSADAMADRAARATAAGGVWLKRDDLLLDGVGTKARKLAPFFAEAQHTGTGIRTYGGPFSNHLHATARLGHELGVATQGVVRGSHGAETPTLIDCRAWGMELTRISKAEYDRQTEAVRERAFVPPAEANCAAGWLTIPPGGAHPWAIAACAVLGDALANQITATLSPAQPVVVVVPAGYGTTAAGLAEGLARTLAPSRQVALWVVPAATPLDAATRARLEGLARTHEGADSPVEVSLRASRFTRFAPRNPELAAAAKRFHAAWGVLLDPIYTIKAMDVVMDAWRDPAIHAATQFVVIHTGGLQGWSGVSPRLPG